AGAAAHQLAAVAVYCCQGAAVHTAGLRRRCLIGKRSRKWLAANSKCSSQRRQDRDRHSAPRLRQEPPGLGLKAATTRAPAPPEELRVTRDLPLANNEILVSSTRPWRWRLIVGLGRRKVARSGLP